MRTLEGAEGFKLDMDADINGTSFHQVTVTIKPTRLIELLGDSDHSDDYKVSKEWSFSDDEGNVVTLYDWKETSLYDNGLPSPNYLWSADHLLVLHLGHHSKDYELATKIKNYLEARCK